MSNDLLHAGIFMLLLSADIFQKKKKKSEYYQSVKRFGSRLVLSVLFLVKNVCKGKNIKGQNCEVAGTTRKENMVECLTRDRGVAGSSLTGVTVLCP